MLKVFIFTKKKIILILTSFFLSIFLVFFSINMIFTYATKKKLPIYWVDAGKKISFSFDAAWGNEQTPELLRILANHNVKATFFLTGQWVDKYPESVKAIFDAGHDVENHSDTHPDLTKLDKEEIRQQIERCNEKIKNIIYQKPMYFRCPFGAYNNKVIEVIEELGMFAVQWNVDSLDWKNKTPEQMLEILNKKIEPGSIVLLHNGGKFTTQVLPMMIELVRKKDYEICKISDLIIKKNYIIEHNGKQVIENDEK